MQPDKRPKFCDLILLDNCMLRCRTCFMWKCQRDREFVPSKVYAGFINSLYGAFGNDLQIQFVGGEPLYKPGIMDLIKQADIKGFHTAMTTNGQLLNRQRAEELADSGLKSLTLSIDSIEPSVHDFLRGRTGAFRRVKRALKYFAAVRRKTQSISVVCTINRLNLDDIISLSDWARQREDVDAISFQAIDQPFFTDPDPEWFRSPAFSYLWPQDVLKVQSVLTELALRKEKGGYKIANSVSQLKGFEKYFSDPLRQIRHNGCHLGYESLSVNSLGDVYLCFDHEPIGNIIRDPLSRMWSSEKAEKVRAGIRQCRRNCKSMMNCFSEDGFSV